MIIDTFQRGSGYALGALWSGLFPGLMKLVEQGEALPDGRYPLAGGPEKGGVMVSVETYEPKDESQARYESHELMADIQAVLSGDEYLDVFPLRGEEAESMRDNERDLVFYAEKPEAACRVHLKPGLFALVLPGEAHMPCQRACSDKVKKLVVKIPADKLSTPPCR
ncbi:YhcH/YjgK/YiaL family protein [uncultured Mailhella sp.]|uniref:YhcH/YjgK/YiaL family protein n=1 Tax=uncultured Mailhella sp. TaxID=1981031 RepID=UPI0025FB0836|nr:YhcH/YjgK/YiaL family protein [uncultured Mailhella sp.]